MARRKCFNCEREEPTYIFDGTCPEGGRCEFLTEEETAARKCRAKFKGDRCAYDQGHDGPHWTISAEGEVSWTEESQALHQLSKQMKELGQVVEMLADDAAAWKSGEDVHRARHAKLHAMLDELVADWILHTSKPPSSATVLELMHWANEQRLAPTPTPKG
jgi:hypothetical protein